MRTHLQPDDNNHDFEHLKPCHCPECGKKCLTAHHLRGHMQRKHFAKNKQNYGQFLMKYKHLEAIGAGPGALTNGSKSRKADKKKRDVQELKKAQFPNGLEFNRNGNKIWQLQEDRHRCIFFQILCVLIILANYNPHFLVINIIPRMRASP